MQNKKNIAVIFGGRSGEHEVSLSSAMGVIKNLNKKKYNIIPIAITKKGDWLIGSKGRQYLKIHSKSAGKENAISVRESQKLVSKNDKNTFIKYFEINKSKIDLAFPILHGPYGEDGKIQGMLDVFGISYVFSACLPNALGMDKYKTKILAKHNGIPTPEDVLLNKEEKYSIIKILKKLSFPIMIKPVELGSSVGVYKADNKTDLKKFIKKSFKFGNSLLLEQYIKGREFSITIMQDGKSIKPLAITEIIPLISEFYDYKAKYAANGSKHICPAELSLEIKNLITKYALAVFKSIGCKDLARVDFILDDIKNKPYFIEINTIPGMTKTSLAPESARLSGINFTDFLDILIANNL